MQIKSKAENTNAPHRIAKSNTLSSEQPNVQNFEDNSVSVLTDDFPNEQDNFDSPADLRMYPQFGHVYDINSIAVSNDSKYLLSGSRDESFRLWETETGILLYSFDAGMEVRAIAFSPDNKLAILGDLNGQIAVFDLVQKNRIQLIKTKLGSIRKSTLKVFPDGRRVLVGYCLNNLHIWDIESGKLIQSLGGDEKRFMNDKSHVREDVGASAILPDGLHVVGGYASGKLKFWNAETGEQVDEIDAHTGHINTITLSKDGKSLFSGASDGVKQWNIQSKQLLRQYSNVSNVWSIELSLDETQAWLSAGDSSSILPSQNRILLLDLKSGGILEGEGMNRNYFTGALLTSPDGTFAAAGDAIGNIIIWDQSTREIRQKLQGRNGKINSVAVSPNGLIIATASMDKHLYLWDAEQTALLTVLKGHVSWPNTVVFSANGKHLLSSSRSQDFVRLWDVNSLQNIRLFDPGGVAKPIDANAIAFTPDEKQVVICNILGEVRIFNLSNGEMTNSFQVGGNCDAMAITKDGKNLLIGIDDGIQVFDFNSGRSVKTIPLPTNGVDEIAVSSDGVHAATALLKGVYLMNILEGRISRTFAMGTYEAIAFSPDGSLIASANLKREIIIWEVNSGNIVTKLKGHAGNIESLKFSASGQQLVSAGKDGFTKIWNISTGEAITLLTWDDEWLVYSDDGYFDASRRGGELAAVISGMKGFRIDQAAVRNNRPDILLEKIGISNTDLKLHFQALYQRRLKKLGIKEENLTDAFQRAPIAKVEKLSKNGKYADLQFKVSDRRYSLSFYNVFVNDVPMYGATGKAISGKIQTVNERIELTSGRNKIEVSTMNSAGLESLRDGRVVTYTNDVQGDLYYLGFGVSDYNDPSLALKFAAKDALDLESLFKKAAGFRNVYVRTYVNNQVTIESVRQAKEFLKAAKTDDTVVLFVAGHGLYGGKDSSKYFYITHNADLSRLEQTAADFDAIEDLLQNIAPRRKLFLMDTCQSGDLQNELATSNNKYGEIGHLRSRGIRAKTKNAINNGSANFGFSSDRSRYIYNDLLRRSGAIVLSSSRGTELSYERDDFQNGVFTETVLAALSNRESDTNRDGRISTDELRDYVIKQVPKLSADMQHPVVDRDNLYMLFSLPLIQE